MTEILAWGTNSHGQLGNQSKQACLEPVALEAFRGTNVRQISAGSHHSIAVAELGDVLVWGRASEGQWGNGLRHPTPLREGQEMEESVRRLSREQQQGMAAGTPTRVTSLKHERIVQVQAGNFHSLALTADGRLYEFGRLFRYSEQEEEDRFGSAISLPGDWTRKMLEKSHTAYYSAGVDPDEIEESHRVVNFGGFRPFICPVPRLVPGLERVPIKAMAAGYSFNVAVAADGRCYSWGYNERFQLGLGDRFNRAEPCKITFPPAEDGQEPRIAAVACGEQHLLCLSRNGAVYSCGLGVFGQLGHGVKRDERRPKAIAAFAEECSPIVQVSCGANHSAALDASGAAWLWGHAEYSQLGASSAHQDWGGGDRGSGSAFPTPKRFAFFETVQPPVRIREISCGDLFTLALTSRSEVFAWGWNQSGALGMGNRRFLQQPSQVLHLQGEDIRSISAGGVHSLAINGSGTSLFAYDFKDFVGSPKFSDISFLVQSVTVPAHRILIFLRCPHLAAMLIMAERFHPQTRSSSAASSSALTAFPLPGVKVHVFRALLSYLYTDHLKCTPHWLQELRELALKFRLSHLAFLCARQMTPLKDLPAFDLLPRVPSSFAADMERGIGAAQHADILLGALPDGLFEQPNASPPPETKDQSLTTGDSHKPHDAQEPFKIGQLQVVVKPSSLCHQYAHRVILAARCRSLRLIFDRSSLSEAKCESQTKRLATKLLDFEDLSESSLETLLRYLYCGDESPLSNPDMLVPMLMISHRFQLTDLKQICELHLQEVVSHDNVGCILILADRYQAPRLRKYCLNHLKLHWASLVHSPAISDIKDAAPQLVDIVEHYVKFCPLPLDCLPEGPSSSSI